MTIRYNGHPRRHDEVTHADIMLACHLRWPWPIGEVEAKRCNRDLPPEKASLEADRCP
jgi:hypothetical protein